MASNIMIFTLLAIAAGFAGLATHARSQVRQAQRIRQAAKIR